MSVLLLLLFLLTTAKSLSGHPRVNDYVYNHFLFPAIWAATLRLRGRPVSVNLDWNTNLIAASKMTVLMWSFGSFAKFPCLNVTDIFTNAYLVRSQKRMAFDRHCYWWFLLVWLLLTSVRLFSETSTCSISPRDQNGRLLKAARVLVWDEAPMSHRYLLEALDRTLRDIMQAPDLVMGGKLLILAGDFRQILPVIRRGQREDVVDACMTRSRLWRDCVKHQLRTNMRIMTQVRLGGGRLV